MQSKDRLRICKIWMNRKLEDGNSKMEDANNSIYVSEKKLQKFQMEWDKREVGGRLKEKSRIA